MSHKTIFSDAPWGEWQAHIYVDVEGLTDKNCELERLTKYQRKKK